MGARRIAVLATFFVHSLAAGQEGSPAGPVPPELLASRRAALLDAVGEGTVVVRSAAVPDHARYRESNDFFYLTGLEAPGGVLVLVARDGSEDQVTLYLPPGGGRSEAWTGRRPSPGPEAERQSGIGDVRDVRTLSSVAGLPESAVRPALARLRSVKDGEELRRLRRAAEITVAAHRAMLGVLRPGAWEYELEAEIEYVFRRSGAERAGFPSIVGSGPNSTILHYEQNRRQLGAGELVVVDVGAEYGYYTADVTRTYPVSGTFTARQRAIYDLVLGAQEAALARVRPGVMPAELSEAARAHMRQHSGSLCGTATCDAYFGHGLSHHIGLDVHDAAPPGSLRAGMVLTLEPGIYLPAEQLGIRIEDDVLVTETGYEVLTAQLPRRADEVERALAEAGSRRARMKTQEIH